MKKLVFLFLNVLVASAFFLNPQSTFAQNKELTKEEVSDLTSSRITTKSSTETTGSAYLNDDFLKGKIMLANGKETAEMFIRYDMENDNVQFLRDKEIYATKSKKLDGFKIFADPHNILFKNGFSTDIKDINPNTLLRVAYDGKVKLLVQHKAILREDIASYGSATKKNKYDVYKYYFIVTKDGRFHQFEKTDDFLKALPEHNNQIIEYASSNDLDFSNEQDLKKILQYYDTL